MKKIICILSIAFFAAVSCTTLVIPPKNIVTDDDLMSSQSGLKIYLTRLYSQMPWEDFKYMAQWGFSGNSWLGCLGIEGTGEAVNRDGICASFTGENTPWWGLSYTLIHDANHLIEKFPDYKDNYPEIAYNEFLGQAYFIRAYSYYQMARRYGGVPIIKNEISYPFEGEIEVPRSTEKETWDAILEDFDAAVELLPASATFSGTADKYAALAFKAEAMLYAGSVAKYNEQVSGRLTGFGEKTGVRVIGFAEDEWQACSNKYFSEAYKAASEVIKSAGLVHEAKMRRQGSAIPKYERNVERSRKSENILVMKYEYPTRTVLTHTARGSTECLFPQERVQRKISWNSSTGSIAIRMEPSLLTGQTIPTATTSFMKNRWTFLPMWNPGFAHMSSFREIFSRKM